MSEIIAYRQIFWKHKAHYVLLGVALGIPLVSAHLFGLILGVGVYLTGIINIPDSKFFKKIVDLEISEEEKREAEQKRKEFMERRDRQYSSLSSEKKTEYNDLVSTCHEIESSFDGVNGGEMFMAKIDEIMWTFLRLLEIQQSLERFVRSETGDGLEATLKEANSKITKLDKEIAALKADSTTDPSVIDHKEKLLLSFNERASIIKGRKDKITTANNNLELVLAEKQRLVEQVRFIRAEVISSKNPDAISVKLDSNLQSLGETNRWISQMSEFSDMTEQLPVGGGSRIGYGSDKLEMQNSSVEKSSDRTAVKCFYLNKYSNLRGKLQ